MTEKHLLEKFVSSFYFLKEEYNIDIYLERNTHYGCVIEGKNNTTGIRIVYEYKEAFIKVVLFQLVENEIVDNISSAIRTNDRILGYSLEHIILFLNPLEDISINYPSEKEENIENSLDIYLQDTEFKIKKYASKILMGDFSLFPKMEVEVRRKYNEYYSIRKL